MTQPAPDGALQPAINALHDAISALIDPQRHQLDNGRTTWLDSWLQQLYDAIGGQSVEAKSGGPARAVIWTDALDCANEVDQAVAKWQPEWPLPDLKHYPETNPTPTTIARLQALSERSFRPQDVAWLDDITAQLQHFTTKIQALLDPEPVVYLDKPCPNCGQEWVYRRDNAGENVRQRALSIRGDNGAQCAHCRTRWKTIGELAILGRMIGYGSHEVETICD